MSRTMTTRTTTAPTVSGGSITSTTAPLHCEQPERQPEHDDDDEEDDETPEPDDEEDNGLTRPATPPSAHGERDGAK